MGMETTRSEMEKMNIDVSTEKELPPYSVLMSVYCKDNAEYLKDAIESMLTQSHKPQQFVIVEDGILGAELSDVITKYKKENSEIFTIIELKENGGLANALNVGLEQCRNELVARMDADDISLLERCERILQEFVKDKELAVCGCNISEFYGAPSDIRTARIVPENYEDIVRFSRRRQPFNHATVIYKKRVVQSVGGYEKLKRKEDFDMFSKMICAGYKGKNVNQELYLCRANEDNYRRRKSWNNCKSAWYVYVRHLKRGGCNIWDFLVVSCAEIVFFVMPFGVMKKMSDRFLRKKSTLEVE